MLSFLIFLPVFLLLLAALGILILQQARPSIGYAWVIGVLGSLAATGVMLFLHWQVPLEMVIRQLQPFPGYSDPPAFRLDNGSWAYAFSLTVLALAFVMTDSARLEREARPLNWAAGLSVVSLGVLAILASNPITLVLAWTAVDLVEFLMVTATTAGRRMAEQTIIMFSVRVTGTLIVVMAVLFAHSQDIPFDLSVIPARLALFMLLAAGLRLGVLPLNLPYTREVYAWRGLGNVLRMIGPASSLVVLGRLPAGFVPVEWKGLFLGLTALAAVYGAGMWLTADNELNARPYWMASLAALAVASVVNGSPQASIAWGVTLVLNGAVLFFYSAQRRSILFLPILAILGIAGLPFNPAADGWAGIIGSRFTLYTFLFMITIPMLIWGSLRHILRPREELYRMERWVHTIYPAGLLFLVAAQWVIGVLGWPGSLTAGIGWASTSMAVLAGLGIILAFSLRRLFSSEAIKFRWVEVVMRRVGGVFAVVFRLNWLYDTLGWFYRRLQSLVQLLTAMLEGDGGILWSLVMLALLISLIYSGARP
jgi:hypothetical protein